MLLALDWTTYDTEVVLVAILAAVACAIPGCFLVLRKLSMMGDAISHAVLPGLAAAFVITATRDPLPMFVGALVAGIATAAFTQWVHRLGKVEEGAAMGTVFTMLFAFGLVMIVLVADRVDLDPNCVLYGAVELAPLDVVATFNLGWLGEVGIARAAIPLGIVTLVNLALVIVFFKEWRLTAFDPDLANTLGVSSTLMHYLLMVMTAVTAVAAFESVGSILVIAMIVVPAATAHLLTDRLGMLVFLSIVIAMVSAVIGHFGAIHFPTWLGWNGISTGTAGMIATTTGAAFVGAAVFAPRHGMLRKLGRHLELQFRIVREDLLGLLYRLEEHDRTVPTAALRHLVRTTRGAGMLTTTLAFMQVRMRGDVVAQPDGLALSERGRALAARLVRSHRLWESYLLKHLEFPADHVHVSAEQLEHVTSPAMRERLARATDLPSEDPHGRPIPSDDRIPSDE